MIKIPTTNPDGSRILTIKLIKEAVANGTAENDPEIQQALQKMKAVREAALASSKLFEPSKFMMPPLPRRPLTSEEMAELLAREREASQPMNVWVKIGIIAGVVATLVSIAALVISLLAYLTVSAR